MKDLGAYSNVGGKEKENQILPRHGTVGEREGVEVFLSYCLPIFLGNIMDLHGL